MAPVEVPARTDSASPPAPDITPMVAASTMVATRLSLHRRAAAAGATNSETHSTVPMAGRAVTTVTSTATSNTRSITATR